MRIGFVHTVPALAATFEADLQQRVPGAAAVHVVDADLLARARAGGVDEVVQQRLDAHVAALRAQGVDAVLVTCSTLGDATERAGIGPGAPVVRVDAAMAEEAVALAQQRGSGAPRVTVLATERATVDPTTGVLHRAAAAREVAMTVEAIVLDEALTARAAGEQDRHDALVAEAVVTAARHADVVVLAQASMAAAAATVQVDVPVLSSPTSALARVVEAARGTGG